MRSGRPAGSCPSSSIRILDGYVQLFATALKPHGRWPTAVLERCCIGLVGAGEALSAALVRGSCSEADAAAALTSLMQGAMRALPR